VFSGFGNDGDRFLVVFGDYSMKNRSIAGLKADLFSNRKFQHGHMGSHALKKAKPFDDSIVQIDQFGFAELINIDFHFSTSLQANARPCPLDSDTFLPLSILELPGREEDILRLSV
jgi:hypothetical protein